MVLFLFHKKAVTSNIENKAIQTLTVIIPADRKQIPTGTFNSIVKQSGLSKEDFSNE